MAKMVLLASMLQLGGTDWSANTTKIEFQIDVDEKDVTTFGSSGWKELLGGIKSASLNVTFQQDFAAAALDATLFPLLGTVATFEIRPTNGARSTSNPAYTGSVLISKWNPIAGGVGDDAEVSVAWPTTGVVQRQTS